MGLFSRKNSKPSIHSETLSIETDASQLSKTSTAKSPMSVREGNGWPTPFSSINASEPELLIPNPIDPAVDPAGYLRGIHAVRERSQLVFQKARKNELVHFNVDLEKFAETATYVVSIIKVSRFVAMRYGLTDSRYREIMRRIMHQYLRMDDGNISTSVADLESTSCWRHGPRRWMPRNGRDDC